MNFKIKNFKQVEKGCMLASANVEVNDITIYNVRLMKANMGFFLAFPSYKGKDGKYYKYCDIKGETCRTLLDEMIDMYDTTKYDGLEPSGDYWTTQDVEDDDQLPF